MLATELFFCPFAVVVGRNKFKNFEDLEPLDTALIFGAIVRAEVISPLPAKRLNAARIVFEWGLAPKILVSDQQLTLKYMYNYVISNRAPLMI